MKVSKYFTLTAIAAALCFTLPSCGNKDKDGDGGGAKKEEPKGDTRESLANEVLGLMGEFSDALGGAKDVETAKTAVEKLDGIGGRFDTLAGKMRDMGAPTGELKTKISGMIKGQEEALEEKMGAVMATLLANEEVANVIEPAMEAFTERMGKHDDVMEAWSEEDGGE